MATKYLDSTGLAYFWGKLKSWVMSRGYITSSGSITGNAGTATKLATPITINGVSFDGSANITVEDSTKVSKSGDTMTGDLTISSNSPNLFLQNTLIERGTAPSSYKATTEILGKDKNDKNAWALYHTYDTDKNHRISLLCYNGLTTDNAYASIAVGYDSSGNPYTSAPTPATGDNSTKIATTAFVKTKCDGYLPLTGGTLTGALNERASNVNIAVEPSSAKEDWRFLITKSSADTTHTGNLMRLGVSQSANTKDYRVMFAVSNPRQGNLPTQESIAGGVDDYDARTSNCWGGIGVYYDYSKNRAYPYCYDLDTCDPTDNSTQRLATNRWVRTATGNFACNSATASKLATARSISLSGAVSGSASFDGSADADIAVSRRECLVGQSGSSNANPWYKVASAVLDIANADFEIVFLVEDTYQNNNFGILRVRVRTNGSKYIIESRSSIQWLANIGLDAAHFVLVLPTTASPTAEIWTKINAGYLGRRFTVLSEGTRTDSSIVWTLYNTGMTAGQVASITTAGTQMESVDAQYVKNTGDETISGEKTFIISPVIERENAGLRLNNSSGSTHSDIQFMLEDTPLAVIRLDPNGTFQIGRASDPAGNWYDGARLALFSGGDASIYVRNNDGSMSHTLSLSRYGSILWDGQPLQTSSDERLKTPLSAVPEAVLDAWEAVDWGQFRYLDAVARKGVDARLHLGLIAQRVKAAFDARGLDACAYGILCHEEREVTDEMPAVDLWTVRYEEALAMEAACQRRRADRLEARIAALEVSLS